MQYSVLEFCSSAARASFANFLMVAESMCFSTHTSTSTGCIDIFTHSAGVLLLHSTCVLPHFTHSLQMQLQFSMLDRCTRLLAKLLLES